MSKFLILSFSLLTLLSACAPAQEFSNSVVEEPVELFTFSEQEYDFGVLKQSGGISSYDFEFTYNGEEPITVTSTPASCACTTAEISDAELEPGETAVLTVFFNPNLHAEPEGRFFKSAMIMTDPTISPAPEVKIWAAIDLDLGPEYYELSEPHDDDHPHEEGDEH